VLGNTRSVIGEKFTAQRVEAVIGWRQPEGDTDQAARAG
jgi:hypothetical protein